jgi:small subunit ribosomal protein S10e
MLISKKTRVAIYSYLFKEGVMCAEKNYMSEKSLGRDQADNEIVVKNLEVVKLMQSLTSKGYVREQFNWSWYYYFLTNEGVEYLRDYLHLPADMVPATMKKSAADEAAEAAGEEGEKSWGGDAGGEYRRDGGLGRGGGRFSDRSGGGGGGFSR